MRLGIVPPGISYGAEHCTLCLPHRRHISCFCAPQEYGIHSSGFQPKSHFILNSSAQLYLPANKASPDSIIYVNSLTKVPCRIVIHYWFKWSMWIITGLFSEVSCKYKNSLQRAGFSEETNISELGKKKPKRKGKEREREEGGRGCSALIHMKFPGAQFQVTSINELAAVRGTTRQCWQNNTTAHRKYRPGNSHMGMCLPFSTSVLLFASACSHNN